MFVHDENIFDFEWSNIGSDSEMEMIFPLVKEKNSCELYGPTTIGQFHTRFYESEL